MKIVTTITLFIMTLSGTALANQSHVEINNNSFESQLCLDAATGEKSLDEIAKQMNIIVNNKAGSKNNYGLMFLRIGYNKPVEHRSNRRSINSFVK